MIRDTKCYIVERRKTSGSKTKAVRLPLKMIAYLGDASRRNLKTQQKIADEIGSKQASVSHWKTGQDAAFADLQRAEPTDRDLRGLATPVTPSPAAPIHLCTPVDVVEDAAFADLQRAKPTDRDLTGLATPVTPSPAAPIDLIVHPR